MHKVTGREFVVFIAVSTIVLSLLLLMLKWCAANRYSQGIGDREEILRYEQEVE